MFYPQTINDNKLLESFKDIIEKYKFKIDKGLYIKKHNSLYPRLQNTKKRGKSAGLEVIHDLCVGLIDEPHFNIIFDIMKTDIEITFDKKLDCYKSSHLLSFINLSLNETILNPNTDLKTIKNMIRNGKFTATELTEISKLVMGLPIYGY